MPGMRRWIAAVAALALGVGSVVAAVLEVRDHTVSHRVLLSPTLPTTALVSPAPSATRQTSQSVATPKRATVYSYYYLWWTNQHWHDKLGTAYPYGTVPIPGTTDAQGCNPKVFYSAAQIVDVPSEGLYDQAQSSTFTRHIGLAAGAGLKGFLASWQGTGSASQGPQSSGYNSRLNLLVSAVDSYNRSHGTTFGLGLAYEAFGDYNRPAADVIADLRYFYREYGSDPAFRNSYSSKPIVMWLDSRKFSGQTIQAVSAALKRYVYLLGDETAKSWLIDGRNFDGTGYYWSSQDPWNNPRSGSAVAQLAAEVHAAGKKWFAPFVAGYNKQLLGDVCVQRRGLLTLQQLWRINGASHPDGWFAISWNEFVENTYLEPSKRFGATYLNAVSALIKAG